MKKSLSYIIVTSMVIFTSACGGGGGGSSSNGGTPSDDVTGLAIGEQMSLVTADESSASSSLSRTLRFAVPTTGDYTTDEAQYYVYDDSMEALSIVNEILCYFHQTDYSNEAVLNQGPYQALVDANLCDRDQDHSGDSSNQSSSQEQDFETWTVDSSREDNDSPQIVKAWVPDEEMGGEIQAKVTITEAASDTNPFGTFSMDFESGDIMHGNLSVSETDDGMLEMEFFMEMGSDSEKIHAILDPNSDAGQAFAERSYSYYYGTEDYGDSSTAASESGSFSESIDVAFNETHYLANSGDSAKCLDRQNFDRNVWEYNLYDEAGARVELNSGFGIKKDEFYGWASYWGTWMPEEANLASGDILTSDDGETDYNFFQGGGRLVRRTRHVMTLADLVGEEMQMWNNDTWSVDTVRIEDPNPSDPYIAIQLIGSDVCDDTGCHFEESTPTTITFDSYEWVGLWKHDLNMNFVADESGRFTSDMEVPYYSQEFVSIIDPLFDNGPVDFSCYTNCLKPGLTTDDLMNNDPYLPYDWENVSATTYTLDPTTYTLSSDGQSVNIDVAAQSSDGSYSNYMWGAMSGEMVTSDVTDITAENYWEIYNQDVTYTWETGPNEWNHYSALLDSNNEAVEFDQPMECLYEHPDQGRFFLSYGGPGQLWGIPWIESDNENGHGWQQAFSLDDGSEISCDGTNYYTRAMSVELTMQEDDASECSDLEVGEIGEPDNEFTDPSIGDNPCTDAECQTLSEILGA